MSFHTKWNNSVIVEESEQSASDGDPSTHQIPTTSSNILPNSDINFDPDGVYFAGVSPTGNPNDSRTGGILVNDDEQDFSDNITIRGLDLSIAKRFGVGSGHILNDLCASLWFSYLLLYFENVVSLSSDYAAYLMLLGQIVDGISTPLIGYEADRSSHCIFFCRNYGRCKSWHLFGVILVALSFPFIFTPCIGCDGAEDWAKLIYYAPFIVIFQIGWASTQISHLALIPKMNPDDLVRTELLSIRYGFTVASNITIFILAWQTFGFKAGETIDSSDALGFRNVAFMAVGIGLVFTVLFHLSVREHTDDYVKRCVALRAKSEASQSDSGLSRSSEHSWQNRNQVANVITRNIPEENDGFDQSESRRSLLSPDSDISEESDDTDPTQSSNSNVITRVVPAPGGTAPERIYSLSTKCLSLGREHMRIKDWLRLPQFYVVAIIYMMTRLSVNVTQVYVPLYLQKSLKLAAATVATIPLTMYIFGFIVAIFMKTINRLLGRQLSYILGACLAVTGSICIVVLELEGGDTVVSKYGIYGVAALLGSGASILLITSLSITADLIGNNVESGAFVYGAMSFTDKLSCGMAVMLINTRVPCQKDDSTDCSAIAEDSLGSFYKHVLAYASGGCALVGVLGVILVTFIIFIRRTSQSHRSRQY